MRTRRSFPRHACPLLSLGYARPSLIPAPASRQHRRLLQTLKEGAQVMFDLEKRRALVYSFQKGMQRIMELTARTLAWLVKEGHVALVGREGRLLLYTPAHRAP